MISDDSAHRGQRWREAMEVITFDVFLELLWNLNVLVVALMVFLVLIFPWSTDVQAQACMFSSTCEHRAHVHHVNRLEVTYGRCERSHTEMFSTIFLSEILFFSILPARECKFFVFVCKVRGIKPENAVLYVDECLFTCILIYVQTKMREELCKTHCRSKYKRTLCEYFLQALSPARFHFHMLVC